LEIAKILVGSPVLCEFHRSPHQLTGILLELLFKPIEQREGIRRGAGETRNHLTLADAADFAGVALHHGLAKANLAVASHDDLAALPDCYDRCHSLPVRLEGSLRWRLCALLMPM